MVLRPFEPNPLSLVLHSRGQMAQIPDSLPPSLLGPGTECQWVYPGGLSTQASVSLYAKRIFATERKEREISLTPAPSSKKKLAWFWAGGGKKRRDKRGCWSRGLCPIPLTWLSPGLAWLGVRAGAPGRFSPPSFHGDEDRTF